MNKVNGIHECFRCGKNTRWEAEVFNGSPVGVIRPFSSDQSAEIVFVDKNKVELTIRCKNCYNINKFEEEI